ncbi:hypothetical protein [Epilithonimonas caeni]|uniref:hypothetical protein n=1 Tax=Epilithonimonas caeni TaxID=365343 RepID=UPI0004136C0A|nr:hypothetical protein [Epilithonimonas caeni]
MTQILYKQKSSMRRGETIRGMNFVSPLVEYKFYNQTSQQIYKKYFVDANPPLEGTFNIISDVASDVSDEIKKTVKDFYYYNKIEPQYFAFTVVMFSSTEATKLKECFEVSEPSDNEILIFVEDNKNDSASGTYGAIRISPKIIATLGSQNRLAYDVKDNKNIYDELKKIVPELTNDQIKSLLHNGYIEDTRINTIKTWLKIASFFSSGIDAIFPGLGILTNNMVRKATSDSLAKVIEKIEEARLEEYRWQPKAPKTENGEIDKNYNYQPLISVDEKDNATVNIAQFSSLLQKKLDEQDAFVKAKLKISQKFDEKGEPNNLLEFLYHNYFKAYKVAKSTISQIQELSDIEILKYGVKAYNALLCGVWNGLVDAVSGLFAMVKMIYDGITLGKDFVQNIDKYLPTLLEQFDEAIQAIEKLNFTEIAKYIYEKLKDINLTFNPIACAYFIGYAYGFVISLIIEIILTVVATGATLTIPVIVEKLSEALFGIFRLGFSAAKGVAKTIRSFSRFVVKSIEDLIKGFQELLNFLKKGWSDIKQIIDDTFKDVAKILDEQANVFIKKLPSNFGKFVDLLTKNFPQVQRRIVNGLLVIEFKGNILARINAKGIIVEIKYFRELKDYVYFTELKNVKIELEVVDDLGKTTVKKYEDTVEVMKKGDDIAFRAKFEEGKVRDGEYINYTFEKSGNYNPFSIKPTSKSKVIDKVLKEGDEFYIVEFKDRTLQRAVPGSWASDYKVKNIKELREKLQVIKEFKDEARGELVVRKYKVKIGKELSSREGYVGHLESGVSTGPKQWEFIEAWEEKTFKSFIEEIDSKILK